MVAHGQRAVAEPLLREAYQLRQKQARQQRLKEVIAKVEAECIPADAAPGYANKVKDFMFELEAKIVRHQILVGRAAHRRPRHAHRAADLASAPACCRARTARRCSRAARRRRWSWPRSAPRATSSASTR